MMRHIVWGQRERPFGLCICVGKVDSMTPSPTTRADELAESLGPLERELLLGESGGWGSWMFECGAGLCAKGLGRRQNGSIYFDTPLAKQVATALRAKTIKE